MPGAIEGPIWPAPCAPAAPLDGRATWYGGEATPGKTWHAVEATPWKPLKKAGACQPFCMTLALFPAICVAMPLASVLSDLSCELWRMTSEKDDAREAISASVHSLRVARVQARPAQISRTVLALTPNCGAIALQCSFAPRRS